MPLWERNSVLMRRSFPIHWPAVRMSVGSWRGPTTMMPTRRISMNSVKLKPNIERKLARRRAGIHFEPLGTIQRLFPRKLPARRPDVTAPRIAHDRSHPARIELGAKRPKPGGDLKGIAAADGVVRDEADPRADAVFLRKFA